VNDAPAYGTTRERSPNVTYGEIERTAITILKEGRRPTVENVRETLGRGAPATIADALKRFWRDLGIKVEGDPAALTRMPAEIADLTDGLWQKALTLASQAAKRDDNAARERLEQLRLENEIRAQSFTLREKELDAAARAREQALTESQEHLRALLRVLERDRATHAAREVRIADLEAKVDTYRRQLATIVSRAITDHRTRKSKRSSARLMDAKPSRRPTPLPVRSKKTKERQPSAPRPRRSARSQRTR
jgi:plasmid replication DNA-binding protein KfrA